MQQIDLTQTHDVIGAYHQCDFASARHKYRDPATKYAFDVLDEKIVSGYLIKLAAFDICAICNGQNKKRLAIIMT